MNNSDNVKQYIILRKDAKTVTGEPVSAHKLAVMTAHASMAFISSMLRKHSQDVSGRHHIQFDMSDELYNGWLNASFTKVLLSAKNLNDLNRAVRKAEELGLKEGEDYFLIKDNCYTELVPDEGQTTCFIAIGFRPMDADRIRDLTKKYQLYK